MKFFLYGHNGSGNHGCEAIVRSTCKILNENNDYIHKLGYYLVCIWIFLLLIMAVKNLVKVSMAEKDITEKNLEIR